MRSREEKLEFKKELEARTLGVHGKKDTLCQGKVSLMAVMGVIMIALVVFIHVPLGDASWCLWWRQWGVQGVCRLGVPWFFFASGVFFARHVGEGEGWCWREVKKRIGSLLLPYFVLNVLWLPVMIACNWIGARWFNQPVVVGANWACVIRGLGLSPFSWPIVVPTWFLRALFVVAAAFGLVAVCLRMKSGDWAKRAVVAAVAWGVCFVQGRWFSSPRVDAFFHFTLSLQGLALFATGVLCSPLLMPRGKHPGDADLRRLTWSVLVLHAPILSVLTMPLKALGWYTPAFSMLTVYALFWAAAIGFSFLLGHALGISRLRYIPKGIDSR